MRQQTNNNKAIWKKLILCAVISGFLIPVVGCANGPLRKLMRGGACNSCQPPSPHPTFNTAPGCNNYGPNGQVPLQQPGFDGFSSNGQGIDQGYAAGYGGANLNGSYYPSNVGGATINPSIGDTYVNGSLDGTIVPPSGNGF